MQIINSKELLELSNECNKLQPNWISKYLPFDKQYSYVRSHEILLIPFFLDCKRYFMSITFCSVPAKSYCITFLYVHLLLLHAYFSLSTVYGSYLIVPHIFNVVIILITVSFFTFYIQMLSIEGCGNTSYKQGISHDNCIKCPENSVSYMNGTNCVCKDGYYKRSTDNSEASPVVFGFPVHSRGIMYWVACARDVL